jgi:hypothetical protein
VRWKVIVVLLLVPAIALAKPKSKVAVAPLDDDTDDKVGAIVVEVAKAHAAKVVGLEKTKSAIDELGVSLDRKGLQKLRVKLEVEVVIHGAVVKDKGKKSVELELSGHGKMKAKLTISAKSPKLLRSELVKQLGKKIDEAAETPASTGDDDDDDDSSKPVAKTEKVDEKPHKLTDDDSKPARVASDDDVKSKTKAKSSDDDAKPRKHVASSGDDDSDNTSVHAGTGKHHKHHEGVEATRDIETQGWLDLDAGLAVTRRTLRWTTNASSTDVPPWVGTAGAGGTIGGEVYPFATDALSGLGGLGFYGNYTKFFGVGIAVPNTMVRSSIDTGSYEIGARYKLGIGDSQSIAFGAGYWARFYVADRSGLAMPTELDMPDTSYAAFAPNAIYRFSVMSGLAGWAQLEVPLIVDTGGIGDGTSYGRGTAIAFDLQGGIQYLLADHYALAFAALYDQVGISFSAAAGSEAATRGVTASSDKTYGITAALNVLY